MRELQSLHKRTENPIKHLETRLQFVGEHFPFRGGINPRLWALAHGSQPLVNPLGETTNPRYLVPPE